MIRNMKKVLRGYWPTIASHWHLVVGLCLTLIAHVYLNALKPYYFRDIVNVFNEADADVAKAKELLWQLCILFVVINLVFRFFDYLIVIFEAKAMRDLDQRSFAAIQRQSIRFFENTFSGSLVKNVTRFRNSFEGITDILMMEIGREFIMLLVIMTIFIQTMPVFAWAFTAWLVIFLGITVAAIFWKYPMDTANALADTVVGGALADSISNHLAVKSFGNERAEQKRFDAKVEDNYRKRKRSWLASNVIIAIQGLMMGIAELGFVWLMIDGWERGTATVGDFVFYQTYMNWMLGHLWSLGHSIRKFFTCIADATEMAEIYEMVPEVKDAPGARALVVESGNIELHAVSFRYGEHSADTPYTLNNIQLHIPAGQTVGFVGKTGAGKTTIAKLVMRLYDLNSGYIHIDGYDIANVTQESLRQQIAVVPQHPQLFHRTLAENIAFGNPSASEEEIQEAARLAYASEFIDRLPHGLSTIVGERGVKLSGGQCQRIAIARAILADPRILILDEATSALDSETERCIQKAIANLLRGRTALVIAHRLSTIMRLDRIIVIDQGRIVEDGTHETLKKAGGPYAGLWQHQTDGYIK